jgi:hypothetical protein
VPATFFSVRGSRNLSSDEYLSHLALSVRLENVAVLLGAGASRSVGGHTMRDVWRNFCGESEETLIWLGREQFVEQGTDANTDVNFEDLLDRLDIAEAYLAPRDKKLSNELSTHRHKLRRAVLKAALLNESHWTQPHLVVDDAAYRDHIRLIARLIGNRQPGQSAPWIFTTNYDLAIEWAAEAIGVHVLNGFSGTHARVFRPNSFDLGMRNVQARGEARFGSYNIYLGKLHGSLTWVPQTDGSIAEITSLAQYSRLKSFIDEGEEVNAWRTLMVFPGAAKFIQTTGFVYAEIVRRFTEFLSRPNACLITCGYSFSDEHINRLLVSALQNPTLQLINYIPEIDNFNLFDELPRSANVQKPNLLLSRLIQQKLPQVTVKGCGEHAFFSKLAEDIPEPAFLDEAAEQARSIERLIRETAGGTSPKDNVVGIPEAPKKGRGGKAA